MKIIGLTGGIGSGKTTVSGFLSENGIPVYNSDTKAKEIMLTNAVKKKVIAIFGLDAYIENELNRAYIASKIFGDKEQLEQLNNIVHPAVFEDFNVWKQNQDGSFVIKEAAILFESGSYKDCDYIVSVIADESIRIERVKKRSHLSENQIKQRINNQWTDEQRIKHSHFLIENNSTLERLKLKTEELYQKLIKKSE